MKAHQERVCGDVAADPSWCPKCSVMAAKLHVVRQTLSKGENHASVPDEEALIGTSKALEVPISVWLDLMPEEETVDLNDELAERNQR